MLFLNCTKLYLPPRYTAVSFNFLFPRVLPSITSTVLEALNATFIDIEVYLASDGDYEAEEGTQSNLFENIVFFKMKKRKTKISLCF